MERGATSLSDQHSRVYSFRPQNSTFIILCSKLSHTPISGINDRRNQCEKKDKKKEEKKGKEKKKIMWNLAIFPLTLMGGVTIVFLMADFCDTPITFGFLFTLQRMSEREKRYIERERDLVYNMFVSECVVLPGIRASTRTRACQLCVGELMNKEGKIKKYILSWIGYTFPGESPMHKNTKLYLKTFLPFSIACNFLKKFFLLV